MLPTCVKFAFAAPSCLAGHPSLRMGIAGGRLPAEVHLVAGQRARRHQQSPAALPGATEQDLCLSPSDRGSQSIENTKVCLCRSRLPGRASQPQDGHRRLQAACWSPPGGRPACQAASAEPSSSGWQKSRICVSFRLPDRVIEGASRLKTPRFAFTAPGCLAGHPSLRMGIAGCRRPAEASLVAGQPARRHQQSPAALPGAKEQDSCFPPTA